MSNLNSEQLSFYQLFKTKGYQIEIPIIQRDYAQGRKSTKEIRNDFLDSLFMYLTEGKPFRDLDFVYGDIKNSKLIPLDGQQRLTTLFLLHWYLAHLDNKYEQLQELLYHNGQSNFSYKTRQSSTDFCNALLKNGINLNNLMKADEKRNNSLSKTIRDKSWYFLSWDKDPTVQSMMRMLDSIHSKFKNKPEFYSLLTNLEQPVITFHFLPLEDYGLTDDLYIKMNSRGKPLTKFENLKAKLEQHIAKTDYNSNNFNLNFGGVDKTLNAKTYFSHKIDTEWSHLFWTLKEPGVFEYDYQFMNFFATIAINNFALENSIINNEISNQENLSIKFFTERNENYIHNLIHLLDLLSCDKGYKKYLNSKAYYDEIATFKILINNNYKLALYEERLNFFAYYSFLIQRKGKTEGLEDWMRVIVNLTKNTGAYNDTKAYVNSLSSIQKLLPESQRILEYLKKEGASKIRGFNPSQVKEEVIKAFLITKNEKWAMSIFQHEQQKYFQGQLTFALAFSGIEEYFDQHGNCDWEGNEDEKYLEKFENYIQIVFALFDENGLRKEAKENYNFHRALLSKGDYLLPAKSNYSFLRDKERDISWKRLLLGDDNRKMQRQFVKEVLDDPLFEVKNLETLESITKVLPEELPIWREKFIKNHELFSHMGENNYIRLESEDRVLLLKGVKVSGEQCELFSLQLYYELKDDIPPAPFKEIKYQSRNGKDAKPFFCFRDWKIENNDFQLNLYYVSDGNYRLKFFDREAIEIQVPVRDILLKKHYKIKNNWYELIIPEEKVEVSLKDLFYELEGALMLNKL